MKFNKICSALIAASIMATGVSAVFAQEEVHPSVVVDERLIMFEDQDPVISEKDDTLIPLRGVFEAMGATVEWNGEERSVMVKSKDNITRLKLFLDNDVMTKYTIKTVTTVDSEEVKLSTAPTLMNERTMVPLRVVSENMGALVDWNQEEKLITITTKEYKRFMDENVPEKAEDAKEDPVYSAKDTLPNIYLEVENDTAKAGEEVTVDVKISNTDKIENGKYINGMVATIYYDSTKLKPTTYSAIINEKEIKDIMGGFNPDYNNDSLKYVYIVMPNIDEEGLKVLDETISQIKFEKLTDEETEISLSTRITFLGYDTYIMYENMDGENVILDDAKEIFINTDPVVINKKN